MRRSWFTGVVFLISWQVQAQNAVPGEYIVQLKPGAATLFRSGASKVLSQKLRLVLVQRPSVETAEYSLQSLRTDSAVQMAEPNYFVRLDEEVPTIPNDQLFDSQWGLYNTGQQTFGPSGNLLAAKGFDIDAVPAWLLQKDASDVLVAFIDSGIEYDNPDFSETLSLNPLESNGRAGVDDDGNGCVDDFYGCDFTNGDGDPLDDAGHGTHVAGIFGARGNNTYGISGTVWSAKILPVKVFNEVGESSIDQIILALEYSLKMHSKIINASWGTSEFSEALRQEFERVRDAGVLVIASAGNLGEDLEKYPYYPASFEFENILTVVSVSPNGTFSGFSSYGEVSADLAAPGANILSYMLKGASSNSGGSMAVPFVTGVAALVWQQSLNQDFQSVRRRILNGVRPIGYLSKRTSSGGMLDAYNALANVTGQKDMTDPYNWQKLAQEISTEHPYKPGEQTSWIVRVAGAEKIAVHFKTFATEPKMDVVKFSDGAGKVIGEISGRTGEQYSPVIAGDTVVIQFATDGSVQANGFDIDHVAYQ